MRLEGTTALVTGAGQGIGEAVALGLAREGADVAVIDIRGENAEATAAKIADFGRRSIAVQVDLSHVEEIGPMVERVHTELGRIDILVNSAGVVQTKPLLDVTETDWDRVIDVNQKGLFFCMQAVARKMVEQSARDRSHRGAAGEADPPVSRGKIVNLSSISGRRGRAMQSVYAASKAAIISLTQSAALALAPNNINVNAVAPSIVLTPMWDQIAADRGNLSGLGAQGAIESFIERIPLKRAGTGADMAGAVLFLCSRDADYITGQCLNVDGGFEMD